MFILHKFQYSVSKFHTFCQFGAMHGLANRSMVCLYVVSLANFAVVAIFTHQLSTSFIGSRTTTTTARHKPPKCTTSQPKAMPFKYLIFQFRKMSKRLQLPLFRLDCIPVFFSSLSAISFCAKCSLTVDRFSSISLITIMQLILFDWQRHNHHCNDCKKYAIQCGLLALSSRSSLPFKSWR